MAQWDKDLASQVAAVEEFDPWPGNFPMPRVQPIKDKRKEKKKRGITTLAKIYPIFMEMF